VLEHEELTGRIIGAAMYVHRCLGPGLLESAYENCLVAEFDHLGIDYSQQIEVPVEHRGKRLDCGYRVDLLVQDTVILELKSVQKVEPIHEAQLLTYLRLMNKPVGLILNFNVPVLKDGIFRRALTNSSSATSASPR